MYFVEISAGLLTGLASSFHCAAMCGPLNVMIHSDKGRWLHFVVYHAGRICIYILIGLIAGLAGSLFQFAWLPRMASLLAGLVMLIYFWSDISRKVESIFAKNVFFMKIKSLLTKYISDEGYNSKFISGALNGFLPCGMVYLAATAAALTTHWYTSVIYMFSFGLGTLPVLILLPLIYKLTGIKFRMAGRILLIVVAGIFIIRGLGYSNVIMGWFGLVDHNACP